MNATLRTGGLPSASTMNLLTGNVSAAVGTSAALVVMACGLFLLVRGHQTFCCYSVLYFCHRPAVAVPAAQRAARLQPAVGVHPPAHLPRKVCYSVRHALFGGLFLICEPVTMPDRRMSRIIYGAALGIMTYVFRAFSPYEGAVCCALLIVSSIPSGLT